MICASAALRSSDRGLQDLLPAEGEQLVRQLGRSRRGPLDLPHILVPGILRRRRLEDERGIPQDRGQEVVEVVGNPAGQLPDGLELLRLLLRLDRLGPPPQPAIDRRTEEAEGENHERAQRDADGEVAVASSPPTDAPVRPGAVNWAAAMPV